MLRKRLRLQQLMTIAAMCLLLMGRGLLRADDVPAERQLPPGVLAYFSIPDAVDLKYRFMDSSFGRMLQDDSLEEFHAQFEDGWDEVSRGIEAEIGLSARELIGVIDGEVTVAVMQPPGRELGLVLMLGFGDQGDTLDTLLEKAREGIEEEGADRTIESIEDTDVTVYTHDNEQGPDTIAYFIRDQHFVVSIGEGTDLLEEVLVRWDGEHTRTFADDDVYSYMMEQCHPDGAEQSQIRWYFNPIDLFKSLAMRPEFNQGGISPMMALGFLPALGLDKFKAVGGASSIGTDEFDGVSHTFLYVDQPTKGLVKFFECPPIRQQPPLWVPAGVSAYSSANWDIAGAYEAVEMLVDFFQPPGTLDNLINQLAGQGPQIHIKDDVVDSLSGRFQVFGEMREDVSPEDVQPGVFALELRDPDTMADVLQRAADVSGGNLNSRDFRGVKIFEADIPNFQGGRPKSMGVAVAKGQLFLAMDVELLEDYLRIDEAEEPLSSSTDYRRVSSHFPSETSIIGFSRPAAQLKPLYEMLRGGDLDALVDQIDFGTLPDFEELADYFSITGNYAVPDNRGVLFVNFSIQND